MSFYFITGLPRSRSAWLANYLTHGDSMCFHDELLDGPQVLEAKMRQAEKLYEHVGHSDPANLFCWGELDVAFQQEAKWIMVSRPVSECIKSVNKILGKDSTHHIHHMVELYREALFGVHMRRVLHVAWQLRDEDLDKIERFLFNVPIVKTERRVLLQKFNVQIEASQLAAGIEQVQKGLTWA